VIAYNLGNLSTRSSGIDGKVTHSGRAEPLMSRRDLVTRLERLEARMGTNQPRVQFRIRFVEPDGRIASTLVLETGREPERFDGDGGLPDMDPSDLASR